MDDVKFKERGNVQLEPGKRYISRGGFLTGLLVRETNEAGSKFRCPDTHRLYFPDGTYCLGAYTEDHCRDLVAKVDALPPMTPRPKMIAAPEGVTPTPRNRNHLTLIQGGKS